jgi:putative ABC transport system substrate-binding protein
LQPPRIGAGYGICRGLLFFCEAHQTLGVPTIYPLREYTEIGGLMSYGPRFASAFHQVGVYAGRVLAGEKPADLPVQQSTKFEFVINLQTVKLLRLAVPPTLLALADEVIE